MLYFNKDYRELFGDRIIVNLCKMWYNSCWILYFKEKIIN